MPKRIDENMNLKSNVIVNPSAKGRSRARFHYDMDMDLLVGVRPELKELYTNAFNKQKAIMEKEGHTIAKYRAEAYACVIIRNKNKKRNHNRNIKTNSSSMETTIANAINNYPNKDFKFHSLQEKEEFAKIFTKMCYQIYSTSLNKTSNLDQDLDQDYRPQKHRRNEDNVQLESQTPNTSITVSAQPRYVFFQPASLEDDELNSAAFVLLNLKQTYFNR